MGVLIAPKLEAVLRRYKMESVTANVELYFGAPRMGKTSEMAYELGGKCIVFEPQFSITPKVWMQRYAWGQPCFIDCFRWNNRVVRYVNVYESNSENEFDKALEDKILRQDFKAGLFGRRNLDPATSVLIEERTDEAVSLLQHQRKLAPAWWLSNIHYNSREYGTLMRGCYKHEVMKRMESWLYLNNFERRRELGPVKRVLDPLNDPSIISRCGATALEDLITRYDTLLFSGEGASADANCFLGFHVVNAGIRWVEKYKQPLTICVDEGANLGVPGRGIFSDRILNSARLLAKHGLSLKFSIHSPMSVEPEILRQLIDMASVIKCYRLNDPESVRMMAEIMGTPRLQSEKVLWWEERKRQVNLGADERVIREEVPAKDIFGRATTVTRSKKVLEPRYGIEIDRIPHLQSTDDQTKFIGQELAMLKRQERWVWENGSSYKGFAPTLRNPFVFDSCLPSRFAAFVSDMIQEWEEGKIERATGKPWELTKKSEKKSSKG